MVDPGSTIVDLLFVGGSALSFQKMFCYLALSECWVDEVELPSFPVMQHTQLKNGIDVDYYNKQSSL